MKEKIVKKKKHFQKHGHLNTALVLEGNIQGMQTKRRVWKQYDLHYIELAR